MRLRFAHPGKIRRRLATARTREPHRRARLFVIRAVDLNQHRNRHRHATPASCAADCDAVCSTFSKDFAELHGANFVRAERPPSSTHAWVAHRRRSRGPQCRHHRPLTRSSWRAVTTPPRRGQVGAPGFLGRIGGGGSGVSFTHGGYTNLWQSIKILGCRYCIYGT